jgi:hypothetical protein
MYSMQSDTVSVIDGTERLRPDTTKVERSVHFIVYFSDHCPEIT